VKQQLHFAESERERRRADERLGDNKPASPPEPIRATEDFVPARDRWKKKRRKTVKLPGTMHLSDVGPIDWLE